MMGARPLLGREFREEEDVPGHHAKVVVLSHQVWTRRFEARADLVGQGQRCAVSGRRGLLPASENPNEIRA